MQDQRYDATGAPIPPLRAERQSALGPDAPGHIHGVETTSGGLIRATLGSAVAAGAILVLFWLPAEYGVDPTGLGRVMGLTQMGEIKQGLYAEAAREDVVLAAQEAAARVSADPALVARLDAIEAQLAGIAVLLRASPSPTPAPAPSVAPEARAPAAAPTPAPAPAAPTWRDEVSYTLAPTEGIEIKLAMTKGAVAEFQWTAGGAVLNYDTHGDGGGQRISYEKGRGVPEQEGKLVAAFTGNHGWFWRNRTNAPVTFTLRTRGDYSKMIAP